MAFPSEIVTFPTMLDMSVTDGALIKQYQEAKENQDSATAASVLASIPNYQQKIISANYLNLLTNTIVDVQNFYGQRYSPAYVVSATQPAVQEATDFWFEVTS